MINKDYMLESEIMDDTEIILSVTETKKMRKIERTKRDEINITAKNY